MGTIKESFGSGGTGLDVKDRDGGSTAIHLRDVADDLAELRTQFVALLVKLDADAGVTDVNYASTLTPAALLTIKG